MHKDTTSSFEESYSCVYCHFCCFPLQYKSIIFGVSCVNRKQSLKRSQATNDALHQSRAASTWWCGPRIRLGWVEMAVGLPEGPSYSRAPPSHKPFFAVLPPERPQKGSTQLFKNRLPVFSCLSLAHLRLLIVFLMSGNVQPNPGPVFPGSV